MRSRYILPLSLLCTGMEAAPIDSEISSALTPREQFSTPTPHADCPGPGVMLTNASDKSDDYVFYNNLWNGNGTAGPDYDHPTKTVTLAAGVTQYVELDRTFKGRISRGLAMVGGKFNGGTWPEFQLSAADDGGAHGDISVEQGCDGGATISSTDPGNESKGGFTTDCRIGAPPEALVDKTDGTKSLGSTVGNWVDKTPNQAAITQMGKVTTQKDTYIVGGTGTNDVSSKNNCLAVTFY